MREIQSNYLAPKLSDIPHFTGGLVGFMGYESITWIEDIPIYEKDELQCPDALFMMFHEIIAFDHLKNQIILISNVQIEEDMDIAKAYKDANKHLALKEQTTIIGDAIKILKLEHKTNNSLGENKNLFPLYSEVPDLEIELMRLEREVEIQTKLYAFLTQQYEESKIQEARDTPTIQILEEANIPIRRYHPKRALMVIG